MVLWSETPRLLTVHSIVLYMQWFERRGAGKRDKQQRSSRSGFSQAGHGPGRGGRSVARPTMAGCACDWPIAPNCDSLAGRKYCLPASQASLPGGHLRTYRSRYVDRYLGRFGMPS